MKYEWAVRQQQLKGIKIEAICCDFSTKEDVQQALYEFDSDIHVFAREVLL